MDKKDFITKESSLSLLLFWLFYQFTTFIAEHANIRIFRQIDRWWSKNEESRGAAFAKQE